MNYLISSFRTIPEFPCLRPVQQFIAKHSITCALGAIGIIASVAIYMNLPITPPATDSSKALESIISSPTEIQIADVSKAQILNNLFNAMPELRSSNLAENQLVALGLYFHMLPKSGGTKFYSEKPGILQSREEFIREVSALFKSMGENVEEQSLADSYQKKHSHIHIIRNLAEKITQ